MLRTGAKYAYGLVFARLMALNDDLTIPTPDRVIGGVGPFDFSGAPAPAAVPMSVKFDAEAVVNITVNLTAGVADITAVTVAELVARINAAATGAGLDILASLDAPTSRLKLEYNGTESYTYMQVYGLCATTALIGQGYGVKFIKVDTSKSLQDQPTVKAEETITTTDAKGLDTEVITDGYRKGFTATLVDTARDPELRALLEGGSYDSITKIYETPTSNDSKAYFFLEAYHALYEEGTNKEADITAYVKKLYRSCKGAVGQTQHQHGWADGNYTIVGTSYTDESGVMHGDVQETELTVAQYQTLDLENV